MANEIILHPSNKTNEIDWIALHTKGKIQREAGHRGFQDMELRADGKSFLRVTMELAELELQYCIAAYPHVGGLLLTPAKPIKSGHTAYRALGASVRKDFVSLKAYLPPRDDGVKEDLISPPLSAKDALAILKDWLVYLQAPETTGWRLTRDTDLIFPGKAMIPREQKLVLVGSETQRFLSFSRQDVMTAASDLIHGQLQSVEVTFMKHALWIRSTAPAASGERFVVEAAHPDYPNAVYTAEMPPEQAFIWLTEYTCGGFLPEWETVRQET